jgi:thiol:disulfide interchange protein/DsbC/DsbD-like thiol-disulfide interchange protein
MHRQFLGFALFLTGLPASLSGSAFPSVPQEKELHTSVSLVADASAVQPGSDFTVGLLMRMEKGWHTYWKNPGEAGLPTKITWTLPEGVTAGEIGWPVPHKYNESGDVLTFGYADENMLLVPMHAAGNLRQGSVLTLKADVTWLECERICIPGRIGVEVTLRVGGARVVSPAAALIERYRGQLPAGRITDLDFRHAVDHRDIVLTVSARGGKRLKTDSSSLPDFYPEPLEGFQTGRTIVETAEGGATLRLAISADSPAKGERALTGVLVYALEGGARKAVSVSVPLPAVFVSSLSAGGGGETGGSVLDRDFRSVQTGGGEQPLVLYVLFAIVGGLLLNIMPCVLPAIALKIFGFVKMAGDAPQTVKRHGLAFAGGIMASFLALAVIVVLLRSAGEQVGWGFQFQEPRFVLAMSAIVFAFGLSLFGVFEVGLLFMNAFSSVGGAVEKRARKGSGYGSSFWEGIFATILATPCTAPFLGTALGFAFSQPTGVTLLVFASVGLGMALPYVVLTSRPAWMKFIPRPGAWMETVKQFMGFLMMGTLLWLLYILGRQLGMEGVIWSCAFLLLIGVGCWLIGRFATLNASRRVLLTTWIVAIALAVSGYFLFVAPVMDARAMITEAADGVDRGPDAEGGIVWQPFTVSRLDQEIAKGKPVFIDFTAEWCLTCKVNEKGVLADAAVISAFRERGIVPLKADWTNGNPEITLLLSKFGRSGVPLYVIFPPNEPGSPIILPEVITTGIVMEALQKAVPSGS